MTKQIKGIRVVRQLEKHNVRDIKRRNRYFKDLARYKRILMILMEKAYSKLEIGAGVMPEYTDPRTGLLTIKGERALARTLRVLNQNGYKDKYPLAKVYSLPFIDENSINEQGIALARYLLVLLYGKSIKEVVKRMELVIDGINRSIENLQEVKAVGARKVVKELKKYKQQIEFEVRMARQSRNNKRDRGSGIN